MITSQSTDFDSTDQHSNWILNHKQIFLNDDLIQRQHRYTDLKLQQTIINMRRKKNF